VESIGNVRCRESSGYYFAREFFTHEKSDILKALEKVGTTKAENIVAADLVRNIQVFVTR